MKLFCILLLVISPSIVFSQTNYLQGYIIKNNGDTLRGYINYREWALSPKSVDFKSNKTDDKVFKYTANTILSFSIPNTDIYVSYRGIISLNPTRLSNLPLVADTAAGQDTIFLKQLIAGKYLSLFYHQDAIKVRYFIAEAGKQPQELKYNPYYSSNYTVNALYGYRNKLTYYASTLAPENNRLLQELASADYTEGDLSAIVNEINGSSASTRLSKKKSSIRLFAGLSLSHIATHFEESRFPIGQNMTYSGFQYYAIN